MKSTDTTVPTETSRRRFLHATAATGALAGVGGLASAQSQPATFRLGGEIGGWKGRAPEAIADTTNPTLELETGTTYRITWKNLDGQPHNVALLDGGGNTIQRTEIISEQGATQTIEFTASEEMAEYICEVHPTSMRGSINFGGDSTTTPTESDGDDAERFMPKGASVRIETIASGGLTAPLDFGVPPGGTRKFFVDRVGQVYVHNADGLREEPFIDVSDQLAEITGEMGLLGMAFHPNYQQNRKFYLRYSAPSREDTPENFDHTEVLSEFRASKDGSTGLPDSERTILEIPSPYDTHNSGAVTFGPEDGYLYMGMGDGGGGHDVGIGHAEDWYHRFKGGNGQNVDANLLGSVLRIDVDNQEDGKPYAIPDENPLVGKAGLDEQFAWGFRNPWRMGFSNGNLFTADVGQNGYEEVSIVENGKNYGWNVREGTHCFKPGPEGSRNPPEECPTHTPPDVRNGERLVPPVIEYPHSYKDHGVGSAVIGGYVYENSAIPSIQGKYVFGDYRKTKETEVPTGSLFAATPDNEGQWSLEELTIENTENGLVGAYVLAIGRDNDGGLYVLTTKNPGGDETGAVHRIRPPKNAQQTSSVTATAANTTANTTTANTTATTNTTANATTTTASATTTETTRTTGTSEATGTETATQTASTTGSPNGTAGEGGVSAGASARSGPGFGVVAALGGLAVGAARLLAGRDD